MTKTLLFLLFPCWCFSQITAPGLPPSFQSENAGAFSKKTTVPVVLPSLNVSQAFQEDSQHPGQTRFAAPLAADISPEKNGIWTDLPNGDRVWRCVVTSSKALGLLLMFDRFQLPKGGRFFAYSPDRKQVFGAYTAESCIPSGKFMIGVLPGETAWLEYLEPASVKGQGQIHLDRVDYAYDPTALHAPTEADNFGQSLACNVNVNCSAGADWQVPKKGVARILMKFSNGSAWCSGSLIANTAATAVPYFLTAHHCQIIIDGATPDFTLWRFDFDYEAPDCANPATEPARKSVLGCERIAFREETDFLLLKLSPIPGSYGLYFNGWNRDASTAAVSKSTFIHHPFGDIKKISTDNQAAVVHNQPITWGMQFGTSAAGTHWNAIPDVGIFQPGSSGCPLFDQNKRIVGQLHGGIINNANNCLINAAYFGRFNLSWNAGSTAASRLSDWLDPANTGSTTQNGYEQPATYSISGKLTTYSGTPMPGCKVTLTGSGTLTTYSDAQGNYEFKNVVSGYTYTITPSRDTIPLNGVSTYDLVLVSKHILGLQSFDTPWKLLAADANRSGSVTTFDIVETRKLILGIYTNLPATPAWRFLPANTVFSDPANPFAVGTVLQEFITVNNLQADFTGGNFKAVKTGDTDDSATP